MKLILSFREVLEEHRDLTIEERNFKEILSEQLVALLHQQKIYWKQRGIVKWVKFGDAGTKFFHSTATIRHSRKMITSLKNNANEEFSIMRLKLSSYWTTYKERLGSTNPITLPNNLEELFDIVEDLELLETPFTHEEIDEVVKGLAIDKSPGPDGFDDDFLKKCWSIIAPEFYNLCEGFQKGEICLQSVNGSYITLLPKADAPSKVGDFRPISLLNCSMKLITKLLANRL